jgi:hypothetical protein
MSFPARYPGQCPACDERIHEGDQIRFTEGGTTVHDDCDAVDVKDRPEPAPCTTCWLVHPEGACDR